jgi:hypothetical protein
MDTDNNIIAFVERKHGNRYRLDADDPVFMAATIVEGVVGEAQKKTLAEITNWSQGLPIRSPRPASWLRIQRKRRRRRQ